MNLTNKSFKNNQTGEIVRIVDSYQNIAITEQKERIDSSRLLDNRYYSEYIDPKSFFSDSGTYNVFAEKILNIDLSKVPEDETSFQVDSVTPGVLPATNESAVIISDDYDEVEELKRKYGATLDMSAINKQNEAFSKILEEESPTIVVNGQQQVQTSVTYTQPDVVQRIEVDDPIITMFKNVKRGVDFSLNLNVDGKIPRYDFIEMMEDSYETSLIDFLAEEMTRKVLSNPGLIKDKIIEEIKSRVYSNKNTTIKEEIKTVAKEEVKEEVTEEIKPVKPKVTRTKKVKEVNK